MLGISLASQQRSPWWPAGALYAADFVANRYMIGGLAVDRSTAFSFTRASSKLAQDSTGLWRSFATNVPAITDRGILLEPERQNTVINSSAIETWNLLRAAVTPNTGPGLDAANGADLLTATETNVNGAFAGASSQTVVPGTIYTFSTILRRIASDWVALVVSNADNSHRKTVWFNLQTATPGATGTIGTEFTLAASGIDALPDGTKRCWISISTATLTNSIFRVYLTGSNGAFAVTIGTSLEILHCQIGEGPVAGSPILTLSSLQSRKADQLTLSLTNVTQTLVLTFEDGSTQALVNAQSSYLLPTDSGNQIKTVIGG